MAKTTKKYTPAPAVPAPLRERYRTILEVLSGQLTVSEAARRLDMPRNHFQTLMHRGLAGLIEGLTPAKAGRPAKPAKQIELEKEVETLRRRTAQLEQRLEMTDRLMGLASTLLHGTTKARPRSKRRKAEMSRADDKADEEPVPLRAVARQLDELGLPRAVVATALRIPESTLRRLATSEPRPRPARARQLVADVAAAAAADVRELRGLVGAESLRRSHPGLSRRQAAAVKQRALTDMERDRRAASRRVIVTVPGILRGFDAMDLGASERPRYILAACDAAVPYRTSIAAVPRYDAAHVARSLAADFERHGAPHVLRMDRAAVHGAPQVRAVLDAHGVLVLHGPPRYPRFYGQLERQNREHAAWLSLPLDDDDATLQQRLERMIRALNDVWRRPQLAWKTPAEVWRARTNVALDRRDLHAQVAARVRRLRASPRGATISLAVATRLAIEHTLIKLGYLRIETGRQALGDNELRSSPF